MDYYKIIQLPKIEDDRGNLTFLENEVQIPFVIERIFWIYDIVSGKKRGGHAYYKQQEIIIALSGSFDVVLKDIQGNDALFTLNKSYFGLYIPPLTWRHIENVSTNALALHISSMKYLETEYIRDYNILKDLKNSYA